MAMCFGLKFLVIVSCLYNVDGGSTDQIDRPEPNNRPIIGVLSQEVTGKLVDNYGQHTSYIAASYVKHLESAGARVVPIWINQDKAYYERLVRYLNGVLLPGGATYFNNTRGYAEAGKFIMEIADEVNNAGEFFPVWGTCLGFELMAYIANGNREIRCDCNSQNEVVPLHFKPVVSRLFSEAPLDLIFILTNTNSTINFHQYCVTEPDMKKAGLLASWSVLSLNKDSSGLEYVSSMEHKSKPYFAVQFHPEKVAYEWRPSHNTPHDADSVRANSYFADFFVSQARKSARKFPTEEMERDHLIYKYPVTQGTVNSSFTQIYFFDY